MTSSGLAVGLLHPGEMGTAVGATVVAGGARVIWASDGRSAASIARARDIGLADGGTLAAVAHASDVVLSVVPPHAARDVARTVAAAGFRGVYVDANAVAPATVREIAAIVEAGGARFVDGGIIGPATRRPGDARIYLAGADAPAVAALFSAGPVDGLVVDGPVGAASALKVAYAGWNKGSQALLATIRAFALAEGADEALVAEWKLSKPGLPAQSARAFTDNARKAWRFVGEMEEIARALAARGLPAGFHDAAGEVYRRLAAYKDTATPPAIDAAAASLLGVREPSS
jgi:3-hydroxyisobutyrate dehydrogenase-like beta-hydroxyacid dehydrogenase